MKRAAWLVWLLLVHLAAGALLYQNRERLLAPGAAETEASRPPAHYRYLRRAHATIDPFVESGAVIFIGDSITEGLHAPAVAANSVNYGIANDTTRGVLARIDDYRSLERAALVVLAIGVNDLVDRDAESTAADYRRIVERIEPRAPLLLSLVLPVDEARGWPGLNARIDALNRHIAAIAAGEARVSLLDAGAAFRDADGNLRDDLHGDGVHLNASGYRLWIRELRDAIKRNPVTN